MDETRELTARLGPDDAANRAISWEISDETVATLGAVTFNETTGDSTVTVTGVKAGSVTVTATSAEKPRLKATCTVTVPPVPVSALRISDPTLTLRLDAAYPAAASQQLSVTIDPAKATNKDIVWTVSDAGADIVSVTPDPNDSSKATVTGVKAGRATVIASSAYGNGTTLTASCEVTVEQAATAVALQDPKPTLKLSPANRATGSLTALITPADATDAIAWKSSDTSVVTVGAPVNALTEDGRTSTVTLTAVGGGTATITVSCNGKSDTYSVTIPHLVSGVTLDKTELTLEKGGTAALAATVAPEDAENKSVTWTSDDEAVATVTDGVVTAVGAGSATITVTTADGGKTAACAVTVTVAAGAITLDRETLTLRLGTETAADTGTLTATVTPRDTTAGPVLWSVGSDAVMLSESATPVNKTTGKASVNLTAVRAAENVTVTATLGGKTAACVVTVQQAGGTISIVPASLALSLTGEDADRSGTLTASVTPRDTTDAIVWESSNEAVATVGSPEVAVTGSAKTSAVTVTAVGGGTARITARCGSLVSNVVTVTIPVPVTSVSLDKPALALEKGDTETLTAAVAPANAADGTLTWESSDETVATVDANGLVTAKAVGTAKITVTANGGRNVSAVCNVTVGKVTVKDFLQKPENLTVRVEESGTLSARLGPAGIENKTINWSIGNSAIAALGEAVFDAETGVSTVTVTGVSPGSVTVTAVSDDNHEVAASAVVTVNPIYVSSVALSETSLTLKEGNRTTLTATLAPDNASNQAVTWLASPAGVVALDPTAATAVNGVSTVSVEALSESTASIIVTTADGNKQAACVVTVPVKVKELRLNKSELTLGPNESEALVPTFTPGDAANRTLRWSSSDTSVATVDANGTVSANPDIVFAANESPRVAVISAQTTDGSSLTAQCTVTVQRTAATHVTLDKSTLSLNMTDETSGTLTAAVKPDGATIGTVSWSVSDESVVSLTPNGLSAAVAARKPGSAVVTVTSTDGSYTADCAVTVAPTAVSGVSITPTTLNLAVDGNGTVTVEITPHDATNRVVNWRSTDETVATLSSAQTTADAASGTTAITVTAKKAGSATVIATTQDGALTASCTVLVPETAVQSVTLDKPTLTLDLDLAAANAEKTLTATVNPSGATHKGITWLSSDETVAKVDQNGKVTAVKSGTATITALSVDGTHKAECVVTVKWNVTGVEMQKEKATIIKGESEQLVADIKPDATNYTITWTSADNTIATVGGSGLVTAVKPGTVVIRAQVTGGENYDECTVTVVSPATGITLDKDSLNPLAIGNSETLAATVAPADSTDGVTWSSSDESVATVDQSGKVTAVGGGRAEITASSGGFSAKCVVTVPTPVSSVSLNKAALSLGIGATESLAAVVAPLTATNRNVSWESDNPLIASVDELGCVTAVAVGSANITVTTQDGEYTAICVVTVVPTAVSGVTMKDGSDPITSLTLDMTSRTSAALTAAVAPEDATDKSVTWSSSDAAVAKVAVDANGVATVTAIKPGTAVVTVTTTSGGHKATCLVTVSPTAVTGVSLSGDTELSVTGTEEQKKGALTATIEPTDATDQTLLWSVDKPDVLELSAYETTAADGSSAVTATAKKAGSADVTVTCADGATAVCHVSVVQVSTGIALAPNALDLSLIDNGKKTAELTATVTPADASGEIAWSSSNENVVTLGTPVNATTAAGRTSTVAVTAAGGGTATITVSCGGRSASLDVSVKPRVESVSLDKTSLALAKGAQTSLTPTVLPADAENKAVTWSSSDESVATVNDDGLVTAAGAGSATITAATADGGKTATCNVTVTVGLTGLSLDSNSLTLKLGGLSSAGSAPLTATVTPADSTAGPVRWASSDESILAVSANETAADTATGKAAVTLRAKKAGDAIVSATIGSVTVMCTVTVKQAATSFAIPETLALTLNAGAAEAAKSLTLTIEPDDVTDEVQWSSDNVSVARVNGNGVVTAVAPGEANITARCGESSSSCAVTVTALPAEVTISPASVALEVGGTAAPSATVLPAGATGSALTWESSDDGVAKVDSATGEITAFAVGTAVVTASTANGKKASVTVRVSAVAPKEFDTSPLDIVIKAGATGQLTASVLPEGADDRTIVWTSGDESVVSVTNTAFNAGTGVSTVTLTAHKAGSVTVTATAGGNSALTAECTVTVPGVPVTGITLDKTSMSLLLGGMASAGSDTITVTALAGEDGQTPTNTAVNWATSAPAVATVANGVVTAVGVGSAVITVTPADGSDVSASCAVTVTRAGTGITLTPSGSVSLSLNDPAVGDTTTFTAAVTPADTSDDIVWSVGDDTLLRLGATTHETGEEKLSTVSVTALGVGTTTITARCGSLSASCAVEVTRAVRAVTLSRGTLSLAVGTEETLTAAIAPEGASSPALEWTSSAPDVASVSGGRITALSAGTAVITATATDGSDASDSCTVTVYAPVEGVTIKQGSSPVTSLSLNLVTEKTAALSAETSADGAAFAWESSDTSVATVDQSGAVAAVGAGTATITVTATTGTVSKTAACLVTVEKATLVNSGATELTLLYGSPSGTLTFSPWMDGVTLAWTGGGASVVRSEGALSDGTKTFTVQTLQDGVYTLEWAKAADARYESSGGTVTVTALKNPITGVTITGGGTLTASVDQSARKILVAGCYTGDLPAYTLSYTLSGVLDGLSAETNGNTVTVKRGGEALCAYGIDTSGLQQLAQNVSSSASVSLVANAGDTADAGAARITDASEADLEAAAKSTVNSMVEIPDGANVAITLSVEKAVSTSGSTQALTLNILPRYEVTKDGGTVASGELHELSSAVTISVTVNFEPKLLVHRHEENGVETVEYPDFSVYAVNSDTYTVTWQQRRFSTVELLNEDDAEQYVRALESAAAPAEPAAPETPAAPRPSSGGSRGGGSAATQEPVRPEAPETPVTQTPQTSSFSDVAAEHWAAEAIAYVAAHGIFNGVGNGRFAPELTMSRAMIAQMLYNLDGAENASGSPFPDTAGTWYDAAAAWAAAKGVAVGEYGRFNGDADVTREQMALMLYRYAKASGRDVSARAALDAFSDASDVSVWAEDAMRWAVGAGLINGTRNGAGAVALDPQAGATRAQVAAIMQRFCEKAAK